MLLRTVSEAFRPAHRREPRSVTASGSDDAKDAGLRYSSGSGPGITRRRAGRGFSYLGARGTPLRDKRALARIRALAIPPAWDRRVDL